MTMRVILEGKGTDYDEKSHNNYIRARGILWKGVGLHRNLHVNIKPSPLECRHASMWSLQSHAFPCWASIFSEWGNTGYCGCHSMGPASAAQENQSTNTKIKEYSHIQKLGQANQSPKTAKT